MPGCPDAPQTHPWYPCLAGFFLATNKALLKARSQPSIFSRGIPVSKEGTAENREDSDPESVHSPGSKSLHPR